MTDTPALGKRNADEVRDARLRLRAWLWEHSAPAAGLRVTSCGRKQVAGFVEVRANASVSAAGLGGVSTCGSVWVCPMCSAKVASTRATEVQDAIRAWQASGGSVLLVTLTLQHHKRHALADTWDALGRGWASVRNGKPWKSDVEHFGIGGYARVVEVTHGRHGWHPHMHVLLFVKGTPDAETCERLRGRLYGRWSRRLAREGYKTMEFDKDGNAVAVDVRLASAHDVAYLAEYLSKFGYAPKGSADGSTTSWDLAREVARGDLKRGRKASRTPWQILEAAAAGSDADAVLWAEWERASKGRRQYAWAAGFRESLDLASLRTDTEVAEAADARLDVVALLPRDSWRALVANLRKTYRLPGAPLLSRMLGKAATLDPAPFRDWLTLAGVEHFDPADVTPDTLGTLDTSAPATLPGRTYATWNHRDQARREARPRARGERPPAVHPCRWCDGDLAPALRAAGEHPGCRPKFRAWAPPVEAEPVAPRPGVVTPEAARIRALYGV